MKRIRLVVKGASGTVTIGINQERLNAMREWAIDAVDPMSSADYFGQKLLELLECIDNAATITNDERKEF